MLDDEVQYLGSRIKLRDPPSSLQRTVTGIALHIEKSDGIEAHVLTFNRHNSSTVHIGRRPGTEHGSLSVGQESGRAMFRCAVVSRRHAKIAFTDSGNVFLIDLDSHHGTHILRPGETSSRKLGSNVPITLFDGDIVTFGKTVGKNEEMVRPVVARVQILHNGPSASTIKPLVVPDSSPSRSHSGRYGLHSQSSSSCDEAYNGQSDAYSDIEEIPPPPPPAPTAAPQTDLQSKAESHLGRAFEVLKRLLPPTSIPSISVDPSQDDISQRLDEQSPIHSKSSSPVSPSDLPPLWSLPANILSPVPLLPRSLTHPRIDPPDDFLCLPPINPVNMVNNSRSESPMDLSSPSPPPAEQELHIIGAWTSFSSSSSSSESEFIATPSDNGGSVANEVAETPAVAITTPAVEHEEAHEANELEPIEVNENVPLSSSVASDTGKQKEQNIMDPSLFVTKHEYEELKAKCSNIQNEVDVLQLQRRKYKAKFNANVHTVTGKFHEIEGKMNDMAAQCSLFVEQIEGITSGDVPDIQARIDDLVDESDIHQMNIDELQRRVDVCEEDSYEAKDLAQDLKLEEQEKVQLRMDTFKGLMEEMKALRAADKREIRSELEAFRQLCETIFREGNPPKSLKRKRVADDEGDPGSDTNESNHIHDEELAQRDVSEHSPPLHQLPYGVDIQIHPPSSDQPSPRKRARKIASVVAQTATAVTMGAVAAWVALAFS